MKSRLLWLTFAGGAIGSALRYEVTQVLPSLSVWLWVVNLGGALALGFVHTFPKLKDARYQALLATGFCGGFTTMSSLIAFATLGNDPAFNYVALQIVLGVIVYWVGRILGGERTWRNS